MSIEMIADKALWDKFIDDSPHGLLFHKWDFLKIMEKHTGYKLLPYGVYKGEELVCVFPLFFKKTRGIKLLYSPPRQSLTYVPYLGPVMGRSYDALKQRRKESHINDVVDEMHKEISRLSPDYTSIALVPGLMDIRPFKWNGYDIDVHFTYFIDLSKPIEELYENLDVTCRKAINSCKKQDLTIKQVNDVGTFFNIMKDRLSHEGVLYFQRQDPDYLIDVMNAFPDNMKMYFTYRGDEVAAVMITHEYNGKFILWMGGGVIQKNTNVNDHFIWELTKKAKLEGYSMFENWGADLRRLNRFKSKFDPCLDVCFNVSKKNLAGNVAQWTYGMLSEVSALNFMRNEIY